MIHLTPQQAEDQGYRSITNDIWPDKEKPIIDSIEKGMAGIDAVWIVMPYKEAALQCARKRSELILSEDALNKLKKETTKP